MKKNNKGLIVFLIVAIIACLTCGTLGAYENMKGNTSTSNNKKSDDYKVTYRYYVDQEEVDKMVSNDTLTQNNSEFEGSETQTALYTFERYTCTNNVKGEWDEEKWQFTPKLTANTTCRLYFQKNIHTVTLKASNGILPNKQETDELNVILNKNSIVNVLPKDGYEFDKVECTKSAKGSYNNETHDLTISEVTKDETVCTISFMKLMVSHKKLQKK